MKSIAKFAAVAAVSALLLTGCASPETEIKTCTVNDKSASSNGGDDGGVKYLVYTDDCGVLTVDDAPLQGQWNSSDTYAEIRVGGTYQFELYGFRNGFMSSYPNIISVTPTA